MPLDSVKECTVDNWGQPYQERPPFRTTYPELQQKCAASLAKEMPLSERLQDGMMNFYPTTKDFSNFNGEDWVPENHELFPRLSPFTTLDTTKKEEKEMKAATCDVEMDDGSFWSVTRVGPIVTTGNKKYKSVIVLIIEVVFNMYLGCYDWTQIGWNNIFDVKEKLEDYPEGILIYEQFSGPVKKDGTVIPNPPIHIHHIHVGPMNNAGIKQRVDPLKCIQQPVEMCYDPRRVMEHHGDYQCREEDGGLDCLLESVPDGYGKLVTSPLQIDGDMNDARACNSEPYEYYYQIGAHWRPKVAKDGTISSLKPMNFYNFIGPGNLDMNDQSTLILTFQVPTGYDSLYWYAGRMPHGGKLLRNKMHVHNKVFKEYILFKASPHELGLTKENNLMPDKVYKTIKITDRGFETLDEVKSFLMDNLEKSAAAFEILSHDELQQINDNYLNEDRFSRDMPEAICQSVQDLIEVDNYYYDRKVPTCCKPWHIKKGDIYTVVGFQPKLVYKLGPHSDEMPPTFPAHVSMWTAWENEDEPPVSQFGIHTHTQIPSGFQDAYQFQTVPKIATILNGGMISHYHVMFHDNFIPASILAFFLMYPFIAFPMVLLFILLLVLKCYKSCSKKSVDSIPAPRKAKDQDDTKICPDPADVMNAVSDAITSETEKGNIQVLKAK